MVRCGASLDAALAQHDTGLAEIDRALMGELAHGTVRWWWRCQAVLGLLLARPIKKRDRVIEALMGVGLYQLEHLRLPAHAAIHATVGACTSLDRAGHKGLVNGVLRNFQRRGAILIDTLPEAARDAHPEWLWQAIHRQWPGHARIVVDANNSRPPMTLRIDKRRTTVADYIETLRAHGITATPVAHAPVAVRLERPVSVARLPGFEQGWVSVQDSSAQQLGRLIDTTPGQRVLDACAAPGGKLTQMLDSCDGLDAWAIDVDPARAGRITENLVRLGLAAQVVVADAAELDDWWDGRHFDLVVLDVPCSGTGVIRRHPDIKVLRRSSDVAGFAATQQRLLNGLWKVLKPGGQLVYVSCSILAAENQNRIRAFLNQNEDAHEQPICRVARAAETNTELGWQILPAAHGGDGFYYATLRKT